MNLIFIIVGKINLNLTYSSIKFSYHGNTNNYEIVLSDSFVEGFKKAKEKNFRYVIFVKSGTVFTNLDNFIKTLENYPHHGLVGHLVDPKDSNQYYYLDQQCLFLDITKFIVEDFLEQDFESYIPVRSIQNIHHDYTPLWLTHSLDRKYYNYKNFGNRLIAKLINQKQIAVNFHQKLRDSKKFLYTDNDVIEYLESQQEYISIAESQLWLFNNEKFDIFNLNKNLICPASGFYWVFHLITGELESIDLVDISKTQIEFAKKLYNSWDGENYGQFAYDFIKQNNLKHFNLNKDIDKLERIKLLKKDYFIDNLNSILNDQLNFYNILNFKDKWNNKKYGNVNFYNENILHFRTDKKADIWISNILDYKYSFVKFPTEWPSLNHEYNSKNNFKIYKSTSE